MLDRVVVRQVGRGLADALPQAPGGLPGLPCVHLRGDALGLLQGGLAGFRREDRFERVGGPPGVTRGNPGGHVAHEVDHAPLVAGPGRQFADRRDRSGAPVAHHQTYASQTPRDQGGNEVPPARRILLHAFRHADHLPAPIDTYADRHGYADVFDRAAPASLVPHAIHEHMRVRLCQRSGTPPVDTRIRLLQLVREGPRRHAPAPRGLTDVIHAARADTGRVHVDQGLLHALLASAVAFDHRRLKERALEPGRLHAEPAGLHRCIPLVMAGAVRLPADGTLIPTGAGDPVGLKRPASG